MGTRALTPWLSLAALSTSSERLTTFCHGFLLLKNISIEPVSNKHVLCVGPGPGVVLSTEDIENRETFDLPSQGLQAMQGAP